MFHSEYGQDRWLAEHVFGEKREGVFVEFGALDGRLHSNSLYFEEECGWRGILAEGNPALWPWFDENRPLARRWRCAVADTARPVEFTVIDGPLVGWSGITATMEGAHLDRLRQRVDPQTVTTVRVPALPLAELLHAEGLRQVDYLSIDVEGAELEILSAFPFGEFKIDVLGVEDNFGRPELRQVMEDAGYRRIARLGPDDIWRRA